MKSIKDSIKYFRFPYVTLHFSFVSILSIISQNIGGIPYQECEVTELIMQLKDGCRLAKPDETSDEMYVAINLLFVVFRSKTCII
jgi:hypothetical protein